MEPIRSELWVDVIRRRVPFPLVLGPVTFCVVVFFFVQFLSWGIWLLFADPRIALWKFYPQPFGMYLFWGILVLVFVGFNFNMTGFAGVRQPARGGLATALTVILSFVIPALLVYGYGKLDPAFSDVNGAGFGAAGLVVLIGFYGFGIVATGMEGWPWSDSGLSPLAIGFAQIFSGACITGVGYALLIYPNVSTNASSHSILVTLPVAVGWFYSVIVAWLTTFLILDNWPWNVFTQRKYRALAALAGNVALGTVIYIGHLQLLGWGLIPANAISKLGVALPSWTAQLGVWIAFWLIFWANVAGNWPNQLSAAKNRLIRCAICWTLGALSFFVYTRWFSQMVLHEKEVVPGFGGDPLTWVDLLNYVMLIYAVYFEFFGFSKRTGVT